MVGRRAGQKDGTCERQPASFVGYKMEGRGHKPRNAVASRRWGWFFVYSHQENRDPSSINLMEQNSSNSLNEQKRNSPFRKEGTLLIP
jgi:hypothetical protein